MNNVQYYRFYVDHLLYCIGLIHDYFIKKTPTDKTSINRKNYDFSEVKYPLISDKEPRNLIEHLDERNVKEIDEYGGVGGFNVLSGGMSTDITESIEKHIEWYPYTMKSVDK